MPKRFLDDQLGNFIDALEAGQDEASVKFALHNFTTNAGFDRFAYVDMRSGDNRGYSNYPDEWQQRYVAQNYFVIDPVVTGAKRTMRPVAWSISDRDRYGPAERRFLDEAAEFGISSGIAMPIRGGFGRVAMLSLAASRDDAHHIAVRDAAYAATAVAFVHMNLLRLSRRTLAAAETQLSPREVTCLTWASIGKTKSETARMVGITEKTVRFYLERARAKLGAGNIVHAVRLAMERDLL